MSYVLINEEGEYLYDIYGSSVITKRHESRALLFPNKEVVKDFMVKFNISSNEWVTVSIKEQARENYEC